jgi:predicted branched-subunit amino acid permease
VVNLRFVIFAALMAPHFARLPLLRRFLLGFGTGDLTTALYLQRFPNEKPEAGKLSYLRGLLYPNWIGWQGGSIAGIFLGSAVPAEWGLGFAGTLAIVCLAVPMVATRPALCGALVAGVTAVLANALPYKLGLLAGVIVGMVTAMVVEGQIERRKADNV